jgi:quercetin dioxygenase-like cupin family protein
MRKLKIFYLFALSSLFLPAAFSLEKPSSVQVSTILKTDTSWDGKPIEYPTGKAEITGIVIEIPPGGETGWHQHPVPSFGMILEGDLEVRLKDGSVKRLRTGEALAEVRNTLHNGRNAGSGPLKLVVFYAGVAGQPLTVAESKP